MKRESPSSALVVMARYPALGEVKTRLAATLGAERACALYRAFLSDLDQRFTKGPRALIWAHHPPGRDFAAAIGTRARCIPQVGADLGERMHNVFRLLCGEGFGRVVIIGADVPHVRIEWLDEADAQLAAADVVLGPTVDGGYYLIAMHAPHDVFSGIPMSTPHVLAATRTKAAATGLRVHLLPPSFDIDEVDDLERLRDVLARDPLLALPATKAALR